MSAPIFPGPAYTPDPTADSHRRRPVKPHPASIALTGWRGVHAIRAIFWAHIASVDDTPAGALAGVLFALLFGTTVFLIRHNMPEGVQDSSRWLNTQHSGIAAATVLMPFAGISFLWFIGVVRDGLGRFEDRFFASVFLGSGLLFLAMMFVATAVAAGLVASKGVIDPAAMPR